MHANDVVCHCMNVKVEDIKKAIDNGATNFEEVQEATNVAKGCGRCRNSVKELVDDLTK